MGIMVESNKTLLCLTLGIVYSSNIILMFRYGDHVLERNLVLWGISYIDSVQIDVVR